MANTALNRTVAALLTNKSGGALTYGDVVILDNTNAKGFTTTTTGALSTRGIGVILEPNGIANNATGLVAVCGWVPKINLNTAATVGQFLKTHTVAGQATPHSSPQVEGTFGVALQASATPEALLFSAPVGAVGGTPADDSVTNAKLADMAALTVKARTANSTGDPSDLALTDGHTAKRVGTAITSGGYGPVSQSVLTSGTAATYTVPAGVYRILVRCLGAGGGGGGADGGSSQAGCGGGGGGGSYVEKIFSTTPGATFTYTIGTGGAGGVAGNNNGSAGGNTLFDEGGSVMTATGGTGGSCCGAAATTPAVGNGGVGGVPTGGTWGHRGDRAQPGIRHSGTFAYGGAGGNSAFGAGAAGAINDAAGGTGFNYGGGGSGASAITTTDRAGGDGAPGVIIVDEYN